MNTERVYFTSTSAASIADAVSDYLRWKDHETLSFTTSDDAWREHHLDLQAFDAVERAPRPTRRMLSEADARVSYHPGNDWPVPRVGTNAELFR